MDATFLAKLGRVDEFLCDSDTGRIGLEWWVQSGREVTLTESE